jgi:hypothetical protein
MAMLFMVMHKTNDEMENGGKPDPAIITNMGRLIGETREKGMFHTGAGLKPSAERVRLTYSGGKRTQTRGPLEGSNELVAGFAMLKVRSMDEALDWAGRFAEVLGDVEVDVGPVVEPWDLGLLAKPDNAPLRVLAMNKATASTEAGTPPSAEVIAKMDALIQSMKDADVFIQAEGLKPSSGGARLRAASGKHTWTDGPFAESKELISGFSIIRVASRQEAMDWTKRYADILGDIEVDVLEVY